MKHNSLNIILNRSVVGGAWSMHEHNLFALDHVVQWKMPAQRIFNHPTRANANVCYLTIMSLVVLVKVG